jgi:hypothetical protein
MRTRAVLPVLGLILLGSCKSLDVPDLNNPGLESLRDNPTRAGVLTAATGLLLGSREGFGAQNGYVSLLGILGRESYNFDPADPRFVSSMLIGPFSGGEPAFGGNLWANPYANIRNASILLSATAALSGMTAEEKAGVRGFARTMKALDLLHIINTRDANGAVIAIPDDPTADPGPIATKAEVFNYIVALLDSALTDLQSPNAAFAFPLSSGFAGFDAPASFAQFNRAMRARVAAYLGDYATVLTALGQSFISPGGSLRLGVYYAFSTGSGDETNALYDPTGRALWVHPSIRTDAQARTSLTDCVTGAAVASAGLDCRFQTKTITITPPPPLKQGIASNLIFNVYQSNQDPVTIIRNEELILLRAEANIELNNLATAVTDLNVIRNRSGGLPNYAGAVTQAALRTELLYNRRYSLLFEGGHRWIDLRRYNLLTSLPQDLATHRRFSKFPFPVFECDARATKPAGCTEEAGF